MRVNKKGDHYEKAATLLEENNPLREHFQNHSKKNNDRMVTLMFLQVGIYVASFIFMGFLSVIVLFIIHQLGSYIGFNVSEQRQGLSN